MASSDPSDSSGPPNPSDPSDPPNPSDSSDPTDIAARLDRITYLLVAVLCVQLIELLELGMTALVLFLVVGLFVTALYRSET